MDYRPARSSTRIGCHSRTSAGTGILAAATANRLFYDKPRRIVLNEISPGRKALLRKLFATEYPVYSVNAEYIHDLLNLGEQPNLILMNPPFSSSIGNDKRDRECCMRHLRSALLRLEPNGRLVGIFPHWLSPEKQPKFFNSLPARLQLSLYVSGDRYKYHGTTMETRILVFDKIPNQELPKSIDLHTNITQLQKLAQNCPDRVEIVNPYISVDRQIVKAIEPEVKDITLDLFAGLPLFQIAPQPSN
ncbi:MAG: class I SAM-dependent methyltransferase [Chamaesiphon sp. CSU_1_12]|nr:class I SAM-dependent methyltransferase [Chamaesiphon sp. CSU_1_12]